MKSPMLRTSSRRIWPMNCASSAFPAAKPKNPIYYIIALSNRLTYQKNLIEPVSSCLWIVSPPFCGTASGIRRRSRPSAIDTLPRHLQKSPQQCIRIRRAARYLQIHRQDLRGAAHDRVTAPEHAAITGAVANGDDPPRFGRGIVAVLQSCDHVAGYWSSHCQYIRMTRRGGEVEACLLQAIMRAAQGIQLQLATITGACIHMADAEAVAKNTGNE